MRETGKGPEMMMSTARMKVGTLHTGRAGPLGFAATPTFAVMASVSAVGAPDMAICSATAFLLPIDEMALMYALMSIFHLAPWLKLRSACSKRPSIPLTQSEGH
jgi:hypothetical protein